ncbi:penicillin acylase family protein [Myxococcota bacterium]|nr:penicillin acylase family protein [Myxococcota bacterium]
MNALSSFVRVILGERLPTYEGSLDVDGLRAPIEIVRDAHAIPTIRAKTDEDAWFGAGFAMAQDRAGQLELYLRVVRGTVAEAAGAEGVPIDRLSRRIGFHRAAKAQLEHTRPEVRAQLDAFTRGINAGYRHGAKRTSHEHVLFGTPTPWTAADTQAMASFLCFALASNWDAELVRFELLHRDGPEALRAVDAAYPAHLPTSRPPFTPFGPCVEQLERDLAAFAELVPLGGASNAWAVAGARTKSGRPIVAGDPHLDPAIPSHWYLAHLIGETFEAAGALFVGVTAFGAGHNGHVAWSITAAHADNTDLFFEILGPDRRSVKNGDEFVPCEVIREEIKVRGKLSPIVEEVLITPRGPLVGAGFDGVPAGISMATTWLAPKGQVGLVGAHRAKSAAALRELFRECTSSSTSLVFADTSGHIGWQLGAELPQRKSGLGALPLPGWSAEHGWQAESLPFERVPYALDPPEGYVATSNNAPAPGMEPNLGIDFLDGYRAQGITRALGARTDWDRASTQALQKDLSSIPWEEMRATVLAAPPIDDDARRALELLAAWDGALSPSSSAASVYVLFTTELASAAVRIKAPHTAPRLLGRGYNPLLPTNTMLTRRLSHLSRLVREQPPGWFVEGWPTAIAGALSRAVAILRERHGDDVARWAWGKVRPLRLVHPLGKTSKLLDRIFGRGPFEFFGGDASTIAQGTVDFIDPLSNTVGAATLRAFIDVGRFEESRFALLGGQSGNPYSPHYTDQLDAWLTDGLVLPWTEGQVEATAKHRLALVPR